MLGDKEWRDSDKEYTNEATEIFEVEPNEVKQLQKWAVLNSIHHSDSEQFLRIFRRRLLP